jgi:hypothetical protein
MIAAINNQQVHSIILGDSSNPFMDCPNSRTLTLSVFNAMVLYQFVVGPEGAGTSVGQWQPTNGATLPPVYGILVLPILVISLFTLSDLL